MNRFEKRNQTAERRKNQFCRTYKLKIDKSHLSQKSKEHLEALFIEGKWFYNYCLSQKSIKDIKTTIKSVLVKVGNSYETREFKVLTGQMKQSIKQKMFNNLSSLHSLKKNGYKVGGLKFKSKMNFIPLIQYNYTFFIDFEKSAIRISKMKAWLKVRGLDQLPIDCEITNAVLVRKAGDLYLHVTTFSAKAEKVVTEESIGIDFGCNTQLTFSNGIKIEFQVPITKKLKRLDRKIMKGARQKSKKKRQNLIEREQEYSKLTSKKQDIRNKIISLITNNYKYVIFQDESIHCWQSGKHGKKIQNTAIGGIIADLKIKSHTPIMVDKFFPSTKLCYECGNLVQIGISERTFICNCCGFTMDRDTKSAKCIEIEGIKQVPVDHRDFKAGEILSSTFFDSLSKINGIKVSKTISMN